MGYCVFANFRIDSGERLQRMKDSFSSFKSSKIDEVVINIRGDFANDAKTFIEQNFEGNKIITTLDSPKGWFYDSRKMYSKIKSNVIFFWIEDHICLHDGNKINEVVEEFEKSGIDYLEYSWFSKDLMALIFNNLSFITLRNLIYLKLDKLSNQIKNECYINLLGRKPYMTSCVAYFSKDFFERILFSNHPIIPRWPINTPFDFEKRWDDLYLLPFTIGYLKEELFAAIDDENMFEGSSLISRGLYPNRISRNEVSPLTITISRGQYANKILDKLLFRLNTLFKRFKYFIEKVRANLI